MDIGTHDEVPKETYGERYSNWLGIRTGIFDNHTEDVEPFVECYLLFHGVAGKCHSCYARDLCIRLNEGDC